MTNNPNYKLRIVIYNHKRYYQFIPEYIYEYIEQIPMRKFIENVKAGEILENKCFLISTTSALSKLKLNLEKIWEL
jgi:hypothetical protein